ncbi:hypothetical protein B9Z55_028344 [Caenorhabditis nigoni]|uniref:Uncharacterized protein n=1 Tax=Caenorhabditis nigoni TaxID=1611254 RepID=A0A2G5SCD9_9PELO|nr:hypothetical protein B9Z55_028344 [Caenorhabditis nigoni]
MLMDRSRIQRAMMSGVHGERKRKEEFPGVVKTSKGRRRVWVMWIMGSHQEDQGEENCDRWTVVPLEARWERGTASEDQENRWTQVNWGCSIWMDSSPTCWWLHWRSRSHQHRSNKDCEW